jgi:hypothetical protein
MCRTFFPSHFSTNLRIFSFSRAWEYPFPFCLGYVQALDFIPAILMGEKWSGWNSFFSPIAFSLFRIKSIQALFGYFNAWHFENECQSGRFFL